jgi:hypothetical protein
MLNLLEAFLYDLIYHMNALPVYTGVIKICLYLTDSLRVSRGARGVINQGPCAEYEVRGCQCLACVSAGRRALIPNSCFPVGSVSYLRLRSVAGCVRISS